MRARLAIVGLALVAMLVVLVDRAEAGGIGGGDIGGGGGGGGVAAADVCQVAGGADCTMTGSIVFDDAICPTLSVVFGSDTDSGICDNNLGDGQRPVWKSNNISIFEASQSSGMQVYVALNVLLGIKNTTASDGGRVHINDADGIGNSSGIMVSTVTMGGGSAVAHGDDTTSSCVAGDTLLSVKDNTVRQLAVTCGGAIQHLVQSETVNDDTVGAQAAAFNLTPDSGQIEITCSDADGCDGTMVETSARQGTSFTVCNLSANAVTFADSSGVFEAQGGTTVTLAQYECFRIATLSDRFVEVQ